MEAKQNDSQLHVWIKAARPRTLLLALSSVTLGGFLAAADNRFSWIVAILTFFTATMLQIVSNLANDYGDSIHGADRSQRIGPARAVQSGRVSATLMRRAITYAAVMTAFIGAILLWISFGREHFIAVTLFLVLGAAAIWAAISYTAGRVHYGYTGLGDMAVLIFFGWVGVLGSYYLHTLRIELEIMLPATSCGLLAVTVLNINNIRDMDSDRLAGKLSIPVRLSLIGARRYNWLLLIIAFLSSLLYVVLNLRSSWQLLMVLSLPFLIRIGSAVSGKKPVDLDPYLKQMSLTTFLFVITLGLGELLA